MSAVYVFGYGSLINPASITRAVKRPLSFTDLIPVRLKGYQRVWQLGEQVVAESLNKPITAVFLDLMPRLETNTNGIIFQVSEKEFDNLQRREKNYDVVNVTQQIDPYVSNIILPVDYKVMTFVSKPPFRVTEVTDDAFVMERYMALVEEGCLTYGEMFLSDYRRLTPNPPFPILSGKYQFVDILQQKNV